MLALVADPIDPSVPVCRARYRRRLEERRRRRALEPDRPRRRERAERRRGSRNPAIVYVGTLLDGVFKSTDGGDTFAPASAGLGTVEIHALAADPVNTATLYAGTARDGVFRSLDGAASWTAFALGLRRCASRRSSSTPSRKESSTRERAVCGIRAGMRNRVRICEQCDTLAGCVVRPRLDCRAPILTSAADVSIVNKARDSSDAFSWRWQKGAATAVATFGDPLTTDAYTLCVFDESQATPRVLLARAIPPGGTCGKKPCWTGLGRPRGAKGFRYADSKG